VGAKDSDFSALDAILFLFPPFSLEFEDNFRGNGFFFLDFQPAGKRIPLFRLKTLDHVRAAIRQELPCGFLGDFLVGDGFPDDEFASAVRIAPVLATVSFFAFHDLPAAVGTYAETIFIRILFALLFFFTLLRIRYISFCRFLSDSFRFWAFGSHPFRLPIITIWNERKASGTGAVFGKNHAFQLADTLMD